MFDDILRRAESSLRHKHIPRVSINFARFWLCRSQSRFLNKRVVRREEFRSLPIGKFRIDSEEVPCQDAFSARSNFLCILNNLKLCHFGLCHAVLSSSTAYKSSGGFKRVTLGSRVGQSMHFCIASHPTPLETLNINLSLFLY